MAAMMLINRFHRPGLRIETAGLALFLFTAFSAAGQIPVLKRSDVVFMTQADRQAYEDYGATAVAWGSKPTPQSLEQARGSKFFGSVGMVTEFDRYYERFPQTYEQGLYRGLDGPPYKVPWLTDLQHKGISASATHRCWPTGCRTPSDVPWPRPRVGGIGPTSRSTISPGWSRDG
jgi:hypothetical protein